ncbi:aldehyde dehydrogenase family protein [Luteolibacter arcticus]|uniref:Aldehyde dehydrogenase n=1 Tax=Luteolibacter arcticus TaxID=1581411 RepID=A0ABT3GIS4_9BACT|nr:aldehyde dehydrogenase family protein [Luteolibacter arcticus]MCW1923394.1 aldehyde dehydrogenase family protein [Luteolibacter arcticus]
MAPADLLQQQKSHYATGATRSFEARRDALRGLLQGLDRYEGELIAALHADLGKGAVEAYTSELFVVIGEARHAMANLSRWMKPVRHRVPFLAWPGRARVDREPCGAVLIIGPWNYPLQLLLTPLVGVLAAGGTAVLKPSEHSPRVAAVIARLIAESFHLGHVAVVSGDAAVSESLLREPFDHIFFTGSAPTGRKVMAAAAANLTPVTLELGGKCPVLVFPGKDGRLGESLEVIARRIAWGKYLNAGQTCVAPDHVLVASEHHGPLVAALGKAFRSFGLEDHARIVNRPHYERVKAFLRDGRAFHGGGYDDDALRIDPTVLIDVPADAPVLQEEIFGPILPVIPCEGPDEALTRLRSQPAPLALYAFTKNRELMDRIVRETTSGGVCFNDTVVHITGQSMPFGGVGESGMGRYRGKASFDTFTRERIVMHRPLWIDLPFRYPPPRVTVDRLKALMRFSGK